MPGYRNTDEINEKYLRRIFDQVYAIQGYDCIERYNIKEDQIRGMDVCMHSADGLRIIADEKADINRTLRIYKDAKEDEIMRPRDSCTTFSMELGFTDRNGWQQLGWFLPRKYEKLCNTHYNLMWTNAEKEKEGRGELLKIVHQIEVAHVSHDALIEKIEEANVPDLEDVLKMAKNKVKTDPEFRKKGGRIDIEGVEENIYVYYTAFLSERPFNLIVPKRIIREVAEWDIAVNLTGGHDNETAYAIRDMKPFDKHSPVCSKGFVDISKLDGITTEIPVKYINSHEEEAGEAC